MNFSCWNDWRMYSNESKRSHLAQNFLKYKILSKILLRVILIFLPYGISDNFKILSSSIILWIFCIVSGIHSMSEAWIIVSARATFLRIKNEFLSFNHWICWSSLLKSFFFSRDHLNESISHPLASLYVTSRSY